MNIISEEKEEAEINESKLMAVNVLRILSDVCARFAFLILLIQ